MTLTLIIENFITGAHVTTSFSDADFKTVIRNWNRSDALLRDINAQGYFDGRGTWSELLPEHWYVLVVRNLEKVLELDKKKQFDSRNRTVESFHFLLMGMVKCLEEVSAQHVDVIRFQVFKDLTYNMQMHSSMPINYKSKSSNPKPVFSIVVDNTDTE